jgi:hypothetical protein
MTPHIFVFPLSIHIEKGKRKSKIKKIRIAIGVNPEFILPVIF